MWQVILLWFKAFVISLFFRCKMFQVEFKVLRSFKDFENRPPHGIGAKQGYRSSKDFQNIIRQKKTNPTKFEIRK